MWLVVEHSGELGWLGAATVLMRMKYTCMCQLPNMSRVVSVILHISFMLLYLPLKLALHNTNTNGKFMSF